MGDIPEVVIAVVVPEGLSGSWSEVASAHLSGVSYLARPVCHVEWLHFASIAHSALPLGSSAWMG